MSAASYPALILLTTMLLGGASRPTLAAVVNLPGDIRASLKDAKAFQVRTGVAAIPAAVRTAFAKGRGDEPFAMAEAGAEWQATDVVPKPGLPRRRLAKVALSESLCILFYELGGRGHSYHVTVFRLSPGDAALAWRAVFHQPVTDPAALLMAIDEGKADDDPKNGF